MKFKNSLDLAIELNLTHYSITKLLNKYKSNFELFGNLETETVIKGRGNPTKLIYLNRKQYFLFIMLVRNVNEKVVDLKVETLKKLLK